MLLYAVRLIRAIFIGGVQKRTSMRKLTVHKWREDESLLLSIEMEIGESLFSMNFAVFLSPPRRHATHF